MCADRISAREFRLGHHNRTEQNGNNAVYTGTG